MTNKCSIVYGGLTPLGLNLCESLLDDDMPILSVSSASTEEERELEEENELFLGRNALFKHVEKLDKINQSISTVFLLTHQNDKQHINIDSIYNKVIQQSQPILFILVSSSTSPETNSQRPVLLKNKIEKQMVTKLNQNDLIRHHDKIAIIRSNGMAESTFDELVQIIKTTVHAAIHRLEIIQTSLDDRDCSKVTTLFSSDDMKDVQQMLTVDISD
ncbi:hypothetical protein GMB86_00820 [Terrilactibacillus sp. BCM23-1]|uniref:NAD(P)-binding domain-containing protein n=1 Tax=Terrilactibacillus tamarindi TaxID=2599694 RepID=A0A6N8CRF5_9BACI|nr:hypothetical protein [Terrilactibacillus tamarindi]MTT30556.1 hypothetical protein [Terrilactibacillus tamarindi]